MTTARATDINVGTGSTWHRNDMISSQLNLFYNLVSGNKGHSQFKHNKFIFSASTQHVLVQWAIIRLATMKDKNIVYMCLPFLPTL